MAVRVATFEAAIGKVLEHEGGYVNHPADPGGETNFGISKRSYPSVDIKNLTREQAKEIYRNDYWTAMYDRINNQRIATALFDFGVNAGTFRAVKILQKAINDVISGPFVIDGHFGPATLAAVNACDSDKLLEKFTERRIDYYKSLNKPMFINGWVKRAMDV